MYILYPWLTEYTLENFTDLDINKEEDAKILINLFIERVYLYENGTIEIFLKSAINTHKITLSPNSSDRTQSGPPKEKQRFDSIVSDFFSLYKGFISPSVN